MTADTAVAAAPELGIDPGIVPGAALDSSVSRRRRGFGFWLAVAWLGGITVAALFSPLLPLPDPHQELAGPPLAGLSLHHLAGTDLIGHDLFSQVIYGARMSLLVGAVSVAFGLLVGGTLGVIAGYLQGATDAVTTWATDVLLVFPGLVFALALVSFIGPSTTSVLLAISVLAVPVYTRVARATTLSVSRRDFVTAARALGATRRRIMLREIAPNVAITLLPYAALGASVAILAEGGLAFLGVGVPGSLSWGSMIAQGQSQLRQAPQAAFAPMLGMFFTLLSLNLIGEKLGGSIDPREANV